MTPAEAGAEARGMSLHTPSCLLAGTNKHNIVNFVWLFFDSFKVFWPKLINIEIKVIIITHKSNKMVLRCFICTILDDTKMLKPGNT